MATQEADRARDEDVRPEIAKGWTVKKEISAGTFLTTIVIAIGAITWGLQLEARVASIHQIYNTHASIEAHPGQVAISRDLLAEQRAIQENLKALRAINADIRQEIRDLRSFIYSRAVGEPRIEGR